jgi:hypothetical protein
MKLTGVSDAAIKAQLFETLREFFQDSNSWREHIHFLVTAGKQFYPLVAREQGRILRLIGVWDGNRFPVAAFMPNPPVIEVRFPINISSVQPSGTPPFRPAPNNPWLATVVENVQDPTTEEDIPVIPSWVFHQYFTYVLDGVLGALMGEPNKSYSNSTMSAYYLRRFRVGIAQARTAANRQNTVGAQTWAFPRPGVGRNTQRGGLVTAWPPEIF